MSQSEPPLRAILANIVTPACPTNRVLPCLAKLADRAFALTATSPNSVHSSTNDYQARILYIGGNSRPFATKVIFYPADALAMQIPSHRVVVDFQTETVECEGQLQGQLSLPIDTWEITHALEETQIYLLTSLKILLEIWGVPLTEQSLWWGSHPNKDYHSAWQDFLKRLELNGISPSEAHFYSDSPFAEKPCPCPSCEMLTTLCTSCDTVMCLTKDCPASQLLPFQSCSRHVYRVACLPCLQNPQITPSLGQCPECNLWYCGSDLTWCLGRPKGTLNETPSSKTAIHDIPNIAREHPVKAIACHYCHPGEEYDGPECASEECWSRVSKIAYPNICELCCPEGGVSCLCKRYWLCDDCKVPQMEPCIKLCPQCKRGCCVYSCDYIKYCAECGRTSLCKDCEEEDWCSFTGLDVTAVREGPAPAKFVGACQGGFCLPRPLKPLCGECAEHRRCADCDKPCCSFCMAELDRCNNCYWGCFGTRKGEVTV